MAKKSHKFKIVRNPQQGAVPGPPVLWSLLTTPMLRAFHHQRSSPLRLYGDTPLFDIARCYGPPTCWRWNAYICILKNIRAYTHRHTDTHTHAYKCRRTATRRTKHTHTHRPTYTHTHIYAHTHTHTRTHTHTCTHPHISIHTHTHTSTHTRTHIHRHLRERETMTRLAFQSTHTLLHSTKIRELTSHKQIDLKTTTVTSPKDYLASMRYVL